MLYVRIARGLASLAHMQERGAGGAGGWGGGGGSENPARPFPPRRRTVAASFDDREGHVWRLFEALDVRLG